MAAIVVGQLACLLKFVIVSDLWPINFSEGILRWQLICDTRRKNE